MVLVSAQFYSTTDAIERHVAQADLVVGAVLVPGGSAPRLVTRDMLPNMRAGSVMVDVSIDQGGCFETSRPTTHQDPTYIVDGRRALLCNQYARRSSTHIYICIKIMQLYRLF